MQVREVQALELELVELVRVQVVSGPVLVLVVRVLVLVALVRELKTMVWERPHKMKLVERSLGQFWPLLESERSRKLRHRELFPLLMAMRAHPWVWFCMNLA